MKTAIKQFAIAAVASLSLGLSSISFADSDRYGHRDGYKDRDSGSRHYKQYSGKDYRHHDRKYVNQGRAFHHNPRHGYRDKHGHYHRYDHRYDRSYRKSHSHRHYDHKRRHNDDIYLWLGGMYILNEALHHH